LADANIPARHILASRVRVVGACPYIFYLSIVFSWAWVVITCFKLKILQRAKGANLLCPLDVRGLKCFQLQGASPHDQGLCPWTALGALPPDPRYRLALRARHVPPPPKLKFWIRQRCNETHLQFEFGVKTV